MPKKKPVRKLRRGKSLNDYLVELTDTAPPKSVANPFQLPMIIKSKKMSGRSPSDVITKFARQLDKRQINLGEMRDAKYARYVILAAPHSKNPALFQ